MKILMTPSGLKRLDDELKELITVKRPEISKAIGVAREHGDLKENAEYHSAKEEQSHVEARILQLADLRANVVLMDINQMSTDIVGFGAWVTILDDATEKEATYGIVSEYEADLTKGLISNTSPIGKALMRKSIGDFVTVSTPGGTKYYEITNLEYKEL